MKNCCFISALAMLLAAPVYGQVNLSGILPASVICLLNPRILN